MEIRTLEYRSIAITFLSLNYKAWEHEGTYGMGEQQASKASQNSPTQRPPIDRFVFVLITVAVIAFLAFASAVVWITHVAPNSSGSTSSSAPFSSTNSILSFFVNLIAISGATFFIIDRLVERWQKYGRQHNVDLGELPAVEHNSSPRMSMQGKHARSLERRPIGIARELALVLTVTLILALFALLFAAAAQRGLVPSPATPFDQNVNAPLPFHRIVTIYGIVGGVDFNGAASSLQLLNNALPQYQELARQYETLDPKHPVDLGVDLVINTIQPCYAFPKWCASWADDATLQAYINFCQQHHLLLFFDLQLGTEPVSDAVTNHLMPYLTKYPFTELSLDPEFHFPNTSEGFAMAQGYPCCLGWMDASEINWAIDKLADISLQDRLPRKVLAVHEWNVATLPDKEKIQLNPGVSFVLESDGFGSLDNKLADYQQFVSQPQNQTLIDQSQVEYPGYKIYFQHPGGSAFDETVQTPQEVMQMSPRPLLISYE